MQLEIIIVVLEIVIGHIGDDGVGDRITVHRHIVHRPEGFIPSDVEDRIVAACLTVAAPGGVQPVTTIAVATARLPEIRCFFIVSFCSIVIFCGWDRSDAPRSRHGCPHATFAVCRRLTPVGAATRSRSANTWSTTMASTATQMAPATTPSMP